MFNETFYVCREFAATLEVPEGDAAELIVIVPVVEELLDAVLAGLVLGSLGAGEFEGRDAAYLERLDVSVVAAAGDGMVSASQAMRSCSAWLLNCSVRIKMSWRKSCDCWRN